MTADVLEYLLFGITLGVSSSFIPGPFQTTVISQTLKHGFWEGFKVICSVFLTDAILVPLSLLVLSQVAELDKYMGILSLAGAIYIGKLAYENFSVRQTKIELSDAQPASLRKGMMVILLTPGSYIFWLTLGGPTLIQSYNENIFAAAVFMAGAYIAFVGGNGVIAALVHRSADFLNTKAYTTLMKLLGILLLIFAGVFVKRGFDLLGIV